MPRLVVVGVSGLTTNESALLVEVAYPGVVGVNTALSESVPTGRVDVEVDAVPPLTVTGDPIGVGVPVPYWNWTDPATPLVTVAVRVSDVPTNWGLGGAAARLVLVAIPVTVRETGVLVEAEYPGSEGVNTALSESVPTGSVDVEVDAVPPLTVTGDPIGVGVPVPYWNWTDPATPLVTVAVRVSDVP
jgi:hypothetical protein